MFLDTGSGFRISFGMISRLVTGTRLGLLISMSSYPRCVLSLAVACGELTCNRRQSVQNNGSLWADIFLIKDNATPNPRSPSHNPLLVHHSRQCMRLVSMIPIPSDVNM